MAGGAEDGDSVPHVGDARCVCDALDGELGVAMRAGWSAAGPQFICDECAFARVEAAAYWHSLAIALQRRIQLCAARSRPIA